MKTVVGLFLILVCFASVRSFIYNFADKELANSGSKTIQMPDSYYKAALDEFPFQVAIVLSEPSSNFHELTCQGVIVNRDWILTTASCILKLEGQVDINYVMVYLGTVDFRNVNFGSVRRVKFFMYHPDYNQETQAGRDLAMWRLADGVHSYTHHTAVASVFGDPGRAKRDCKYITYTPSGYLFGAPATLSHNSFDCFKVGVVDDNACCVVMKTAPQKACDSGSSLMCEGKLYAIRNDQGYFNTVYDISDWMLHVIDVGNTAAKKREELKEKMLYENIIDHEEEIAFFPEDQLRMITYWEKNNLGNIYKNEMFQDREEGNRREQEDSVEYDQFDDIETDKSTNSEWSENRERSLRKRRFVQSADECTCPDIKHLFSSWAISVCKLNTQRQIDLKIDVGIMIANTEMDYLKEQAKLRQIEGMYANDTDYYEDE